MVALDQRSTPCARRGSVNGPREARRRSAPGGKCPRGQPSAARDPGVLSGALQGPGALQGSGCSSGVPLAIQAQSTVDPGSAVVLASVLTGGQQAATRLTPASG